MGGGFSAPIPYMRRLYSDIRRCSISDRYITYLRSDGVGVEDDTCAILLPQRRKQMIVYSASDICYGWQ